MFGSTSTIFLSSWSSLVRVASGRQLLRTCLSKSKAASNWESLPHPAEGVCRPKIEMESSAMSDFVKPVTFDPLGMVRADHGCFGCGDDNPIGLHLRFAADGDSVKASFMPGAEHQGFGGIVHGGIISTVLDEAMAWATAHAGFWAMTGDIRVWFRRPLTIGESAVVMARVSGARGRLVTT